MEFRIPIADKLIAQQKKKSTHPNNKSGNKPASGIFLTLNFYFSNPNADQSLVTTKA
ncbi:hypothetical protein L5M91_08905 [Shewanella sp. SM43]|jgi:hypothetical protein|uniref:hypothetical protein n=1 Tax=Shewanella sp. SW1 TaxID=2912814 RepID=UPI0021DAE1FF|nr:hypothetical protein [Shewanella sp. SW1]MCU7990653.1 hypothetical protein [Shewanella sp. SW1]MCU8051858.1 hypothetical protein [Shewanella sp. SM43]MCU8062215.1 hypothetical protein [Shewanella sp. SM55]